VLVTDQRVVLGALIWTWISPQVGEASSVGYERRVVSGVPAHIVTINLTDPSVKVSVQLARGFPGSAEGFASLMARSRPTAAITGTFFSTRSLLPVGDIAVDGLTAHWGGLGTALALTAQNQVTFRRVPLGRQQDWTDYETVLACGPTLVRDGKIDIQPAAEGFSDPHVLGRAARAAIGVTPQGKLRWVAVTASLSLRQLAQVMVGLGCRQAMNLDGGSSTALYYRGRVIVSPQRRLVNVLVCFEGVPSDQRYDPERLWAHHRQRKAYQLYQRAQKARGAQDYEKAVKLLTQAVEYAPRNASYHLALQQIWQLTDAYQEAASELARAGQIFFHKGLYLWAVEKLGGAVALNPKQIEAARLLAASYKALGWTERAAEERHRLERQILEWTCFRPEAKSWLPVLADQAPTAPYLLKGVVTATHYTDRRQGVSLELPPGWRVRGLGEAEFLWLESRTNPYYGFLSVWPADPAIPPDRWALYFFRSPTCRPLWKRREQRGRLHLFDAEYKEIVAGVVYQARCRLIQRGRRLVVLSLVSEADVFSLARSEWTRLAENLQVGWAWSPGRVGLAAGLFLGLGMLSAWVARIVRQRRSPRRRGPEAGRFDDYG